MHTLISLIVLIVGIISQCIRIPNHQIVHLKCIQFLIVNYTPIEVGRKNKSKQAFQVVLTLPGDSDTKT